MDERLLNVVNHFQYEGTVISIEPYGNGHINDTFLFKTSEKDYILQRINENVFKSPADVMENIIRVSEHLCKKIDNMPGHDSEREALTLIKTSNNSQYHIEGETNFWRLYRFISDSLAIEKAENADHAREVAKSFGEFQNFLADLSGAPLKETIPFFHHTPKRLEALEEAVENDIAGRLEKCRKEVNFALEHKNITAIVSDKIDAGELPLRTTHNDTKINNILFDKNTLTGLCVIDLDTLMPGTVLYDFGDMVRTGASMADEDEMDLSKVGMSLEYFEALVDGYLESDGNFLTDEEISLLPFSGKLITFTIGLRFLTDYLNGDTYFKIHRENHNLDRCRTQFKMVEDIENKETLMNEIVNKKVKK